jgi:ubiquinone/menaquinone biosynthesis C-methylase UbiE
VRPSPGRADFFEELVKQYYEQRAAEYDQWYEGTGLFASRDRPGWTEDREALVAAVGALPEARTLDVACGTGYLTQQLHGPVTGLDQSESMVEIASARIPGGRFVVSEALPLPFGDGEFDRVFTGHFYGHLEGALRTQFLDEARRVAGELVVADSAVRPDHEVEEWQERVLNDGSRHEVYKRYFTGEELAEELGGGEVLHAGPWFVVVRIPF